MRRTIASWTILGVTLLLTNASAQNRTQDACDDKWAGTVATRTFSSLLPLTRNIFLFSNYDGGTFTINVDQNLPNIQIGIVSYAPSTVTLTGPFVSNVNVVRVTGYSQTSSVKGIPTSKVQIFPQDAATIRPPYADDQMVCATGTRVLNWSSGGCNSTTQVEEYFLSKFGEVPFLSHQSQYQAFTGTVLLSMARRKLVVVRDLLEFDLAAALGRPTTPITAKVEINATIASSTPSIPAMTEGALAEGSTVEIINYGSILGAGGAGGSGGNGGGGSWTKRSCGRDGQAGGTALNLTAPTTFRNSGLLWGGGGGGGGGSGCNVNAGGGGGAGYVGGEGGTGASSLGSADELAFCGQDNGVRSGQAGATGGMSGGGEGGKVSWPGREEDYDMVGGNGGGFGQPGQAPSACGGLLPSQGGAAGMAIKRNSRSVNLLDGSYATGCGPIRGPIGP